MLHRGKRREREWSGDGITGAVTQRGHAAVRHRRRPESELGRGRAIGWISVPGDFALDRHGAAGDHPHVVHVFVADGHGGRPEDGRKGPAATKRRDMELSGIQIANADLAIGPRRNARGPLLADPGIMLALEVSSSVTLKSRLAGAPSSISVASTQ